VLKDEGGCARHRVLDDALERDDVCAAAQVCQDLDLSLDLLLLHRLERLDNALFIVCHVDGLEDLAVLAAAEFSNKLQSFRVKTFRSRRREKAFCLV
jgi:hypothetical protein